MPHSTRRQFLADVGRNMLIAGIGAELAADLGLGTVTAADPPKALDFGDLEPLVCLMQETPPNKLLPILVERLKQGTELKTLVAAGALANARTLGGEDYIGFHTMMALPSAYRMSQELPAERRPLPVLKVLFRNTSRIQARGGRKHETLHPVEPTAVPADGDQADAFLAAIRHRDMKGAEANFAGLAQKSTDEAFNRLLYAVQDDLEVHRVNLAYRAWDLIDIVGKEHAQTLLRQSVHYCITEGQSGGARSKAQALLVKLFDQHKLFAKSFGTKRADDAEMAKLSDAIFKGTPEQSAEAVAAALADGFAPPIVGEAISLAANQLILRENGRSLDNSSSAKPVGSVHGDSIGVHGCDSANAWRNLARVGNARNTAACLIMGAYQASLDRPQRFLKLEAFPPADAVENIKATEADNVDRPEARGKALLKLAEEGIRANDQVTAAAAVHRYGTLGLPARAVFDLLLRYAISEDGALHAEKYFGTVSDEFAMSRPAFRWRQLVGLARVTASEFGHAAPGYAEACQLLKL
jgi:hypothetical protein